MKENKWKKLKKHNDLEEDKLEWENQNSGIFNSLDFFNSCSCYFLQMCYWK